MEEENSSPLQEISHDQPLPGTASEWREVALSGCNFGCKIYENIWSGLRVVAHNSAYGCKK